MGSQAFVGLCRRLETTCGSRFAPSQLLADMASRGDTFYGRFAGQRTAA
jgi:3-hydroxyacyl-CoA dehydrogenase / enoyl-CoA hydratase / 3-hydroxybutyryl-CoA epimerase